MKKCFYFSLFLLILSNKSLLAQGSVIGSFPTLDGGIENQTAGATPNVGSTSLATGIQQTAFTTAQASSSAGTIATTGARSGSKCLQWTTGSTSNLLWSPTAGNAAIANSTSYVVQFYYSYASGSARAFVVGVTTDGTSGSSTSTTSSLPVSATYAKVSVVVTSGSSSNNPRYGLISFKPSGGSFGTPYVLDDIVVYAGSAEDNTAPTAVTAASTGSATSTSLNVSWTAPAGGVDGGGYVVVRGTADPTTAPNVNGVYAVGNSIGSGTVVYIGTNTSFVDNGLTNNTGYFYRIYAVDKAFNYSPAATTTGSTGVAPVTFASIKGYQKNTGVQIDFSTATEINMHHFLIEKSVDGTNYTTATSMNATGNNSMTTNYNWFDATPNNGNNFYRIKAVEKDGSFKYSSILKVTLGKVKTEMVITPNPVKGAMLNVQLSNLEKGNYTVQAINNAGQIISNKTITYEGGAAAYTLNLPTTIKSGSYTLIMQNGNNKIVKQFIVE